MHHLIVCLLLCTLAWTARAGEAVTVQLNWKHQFEFAAFYAALSKGYYSAAGLEVSIREGGPGIDVVQEVLEGRAEFGVGASALVVERARGQPVVALAALMQHSPIALLALRSGGINSVHDLAGRPVAADPHSRDEIEAFLLSSGLPSSSIRLVEQTDWTLASLDSGREAAKVIYLSNELFMIRGREHEFLLLMPRSAGIDLFGNMLFSTEFTVRARPHTVRAFREATLKGLVYALAHPEELSALIQARYNSQGKSYAHLMYEAAQMRELTRPDIVEPGYMSPGRWRHVAEVYAGQGKMPRDFDLKGFIYDPQPEELPSWLLWALAAALAGLVAALFVVAKVRNINSRLQREMAERSQAEQALLNSEARYRELVENANAIILRMAPDGTLTYFNEFAETFFGYASKEILGRNVVGAIVPERESGTGRDLAALMRAILSDPEQYSTNENENITKDGRRVHIQWANRAMKDADGRLAGVLSIGHDVSERKSYELALVQADTELRAHRDRLEQTVGERTAQLEQARVLAEAASRAKSTFLANMSHEIRTPLNAVIGLTYLLLRDQLTREQQDRLSKVAAAAQHLLRLLNDILDFSKIEAGRMTLEKAEFDVSLLAANVRSLIGEKLQTKGLTCSVDMETLPPRLVGDATRLTQILLNFLSNAVKFTNKGGINLRGRLLEEDGEELLIRFEVSDSGIGISPDKLARLFDAFEQADASTTRQYGGTGLGLAISRRLAQLMGGDAGAESREGAGSTFWVTIPLGKASRQEWDEPVSLQHSPYEERLRQDFAQCRLLLVEDDEINQEVALDMLTEGPDLRVDVANDGARALVMAQETRYDLILMDMQMPVMDGLEATRALRALPGYARTPILAMTANAFGEDRQRCLDAGMNDHVAKPVDPERLYQALLKWLPQGGDSPGTSA